MLAERKNRNGQRRREADFTRGTQRRGGTEEKETEAGERGGAFPAKELRRQQEEETYKGGRSIGASGRRG